MVTPVELPTMRYISGAAFDLRRFQLSSNESGGGAGQSVEYADAVWVMEYSFAGFPDMKSRSVWQGFLGSLEGRKTPVLCFDPFRRVPLDHYDDAGNPASGSPWGSPAVSDYSRSASTFDLTGWAANQKLYAGDYFSFQDASDRWHLHRLTQDATANGSGAVTVTVEPRPARGLTHGSASLRVRDAACTMVLDWSEGAMRYGTRNGEAFSVSGIQVTRPFI